MISPLRSIRVWKEVSLVPYHTRVEGSGLTTVGLVKDASALLHSKLMLSKLENTQIITEQSRHQSHIIIASHFAIYVLFSVYGLFPSAFSLDGPA